LVADLTQPGREQEDRDQDAERRDRLQQATRQRAWLKLARQLGGRGRRGGDVDSGGDMRRLEERVRCSRRDERDD
jgi:hypothetical protein